MPRFERFLSSAPFVYGGVLRNVASIAVAVANSPPPPPLRLLLLNDNPRHRFVCIPVGGCVDQQRRRLRGRANHAAKLFVFVRHLLA